MSLVLDIHLRWISWETVIMRHHKSQCSVLILTNKNHTKEGLTNHKFAEELHDPPPPPPPPLKLLNRICIDTQMANGSEKNGKIPCLIIILREFYVILHTEPSSVTIICI